MITRVHALALALALPAGLFLAPALARADVIVTNTIETATGTDPTYIVTAAQSFTTGTQSENLSGVTVVLDGEFGDSSVAFSLSSNSGGLPGTQLLVFDPLTPIFGSGFDDYTLSSGGSLTLAPDTTYWLVATYLGVDPVWGYTDSSAFSGSGSLGSWTNATGLILPNWALPASEKPYLMEIDGSPVSAPEPATLALFGLGLVGVGLSRRRLTR